MITIKWRNLLISELFAAKLIINVNNKCKFYTQRAINFIALPELALPWQPATTTTGVQ